MAVSKPMRSLLLVLALASVAEAAPSSTTFRVLDWSRSRTTQALTTYTLTMDGTAITLDIDTQTYKTAWKPGTKTLTGWSLNRERDLQTGQGRQARAVLLRSDDGRSRRADGGARAVVQGRGVGAVREMVAGRADERGRDGVSRIDGSEPLLFAARTIEHVRADMNCCQKPGQSLRFVPADRSIAPAITGP